MLYSVQFPCWTEKGALGPRVAEQRLRSGDGSFHTAPPSPVLLDSKHKGSGYRAISKFPRFPNSPDRAKGRREEAAQWVRSHLLWGPSVSLAHCPKASKALKRFWSFSITDLKFKNQNIIELLKKK